MLFCAPNDIKIKSRINAFFRNGTIVLRKIGKTTVDFLL